jgi:hypothetical protein
MRAGYRALGLALVLLAVVSCGKKERAPVVPWVSGSSAGTGATSGRGGSGGSASSDGGDSGEPEPEQECPEDPFEVFPCSGSGSCQTTLDPGGGFAPFTLDCTCVDEQWDCKLLQCPNLCAHDVAACPPPTELPDGCACFEGNDGACCCVE